MSHYGTNPGGGGVLPIIRLEVEGMRHAILTALSEYEVARDADIHAAVTAFLTPENIGRIIATEVQTCIDRVIREEVERYYRSGYGRQAVREAVEKALTP